MSEYSFTLLCRFLHNNGNIGTEGSRDNAILLSNDFMVYSAQYHCLIIANVAKKKTHKSRLNIQMLIL